MSEYTQGVCRDGAAILKDGQPLTIEQILEALRDRDALTAHVDRLRERLGMCRHHACYSVGDSDGLSMQMATIRKIANEALREDYETSLTVKCPDCDGDGNIACVTCPICDGVGALSTEETACLHALTCSAEQINNCEMECGAYGTYCKCNDEGHQ